MTTPLAGLKFLIVDDLGPMRSALRRIVEELPGASVDLASEGEEALVQIGARAYDVVLCDYNLGDGKDGQQVLEEVRHRRMIGLASVFLMITAEAQRPLVLGALEYQPDDYLLKPVVKDVALRRIWRAICKRRDFAPLDQAIEAGDYARAIAFCDQQSAQAPQQARDLLRIKADLCISTGDYAQAEALFREVLRERDYPWARFGLGRIGVLRQQYVEAQALLNALIVDNHCFLEAYDWLATALEAQGHSVEAQAALEKAIELSPKSVRRQRRLGELAMRNGQPDVAERAFRRAMREGRESCFAGSAEYLRLFDLLAAQQSSASVIVLRDGRMALRKNPDEELRVAVAQVFVYVERALPYDAKRFLRQALEIYENCSPALPIEAVVELARACFALGEIDTGMALLKNAVREAYDNPAIVESVAALLREFKVDQDCNELVEQSRKEVVQLNNRGVKLFEQDRDEEAAALLTQAADGLPRNRTVNLNAVKILLNLMMRRGRNETYLRQVCKYLERLRALDERSEQFQQVQRVYRELLAA